MSRHSVSHTAGTGINFTKYEGNPVICPPEGVPSDLFRDPKVWEA